MKRSDQGVHQRTRDPYVTASLSIDAYRCLILRPCDRQGDSGTSLGLDNLSINVRGRHSSNVMQLITRHTHTHAHTVCWYLHLCTYSLTVSADIAAVPPPLSRAVSSPASVLSSRRFWWWWRRRGEGEGAIVVACPARPLPPSFILPCLDEWSLVAVIWSF